MTRIYPAKILLFGEHTVLRGGRGMAVPYPAFSLRWEVGKVDRRLLNFADYLSSAIALDLLSAVRLRNELEMGWHLPGNIPTGYGLGSSGAVCAAVWDRYATARGRAVTGEDLRLILARMESHFHGQSSGTDPLICYLNEPVVLGGEEPPRAVRLPEGWAAGLFLVDSGVKREAGTFIERFTTRYDAGEHAQIEAGWTRPANAAIRATIAGDRIRTQLFTRAIGEFQLRYFADFIPAPLRAQWSGDGYALKLCGAGGGGMMLGITNDRARVEATFDGVHWLADVYK